MDWTGIYDDTVRHTVPRTEPYAGNLRRVVLDCRSAIATWIAEAEAMLRGSGSTRNRDDLAMLAAMVERGGLAMLPASALSRLVTQAIRADSFDLSVRAMGHGQLMQIMPLDGERSTLLVRMIVERIVRNVVLAADRLRLAAHNAAAQPGRRIDMTSSRRHDELEPVWIMMASVVEPLVPVADLARGMNGRLAA